MAKWEAGTEESNDFTGQLVWCVRHLRSLNKVEGEEGVTPSRAPWLLLTGALSHTRHEQKSLF